MFQVRAALPHKDKSLSGRKMVNRMKERNRAVNEAAKYLDQIPKFSKEKHTVEMVREMLRILGSPQDDMKIVHIAGTNGKGSVCAFLSSVFREAGYTAAVFTSPHLLSITERFAFNGKDVDDELFLYAYRKVRDAQEEFEKIGAGHPSYFEFLFLMFMVMVKKSPCDYVVLETGLGGRLDATNCVEHPLATVITSISLDHMEYLGDTVEKIAGEKAGIIKQGVPVIYDNTSAEASAVIRAKAEEMGSRAWPVDNTSYSGLELDGGHLKLMAKQADGGKEHALDIPFAAEYQAVNSMLAFRTAEILGIDAEVISRGIGHAVWPGRMEQIMENVYLDGAHNEGGIREFAKAARAIAAKRGDGRRILLFAVVSDKEYREMAEILCREFMPDVLILTQIEYGRGLDIRKLDEAAHDAWKNVDSLPGRTEAAGRADGESGHDIRVIPTVAEALKEAVREKKPEDTVFCAGSLYLIGEIKDVLRRNEA